MQTSLTTRLVLGAVAVGHFLVPFLPPSAHAGEAVPLQPVEAKQHVTAQEPWKFNLSIPVWLAGISGNVGVRNRTNSVDVGADVILRHLDMTASFGAEARKGRFGLYGDFLYVSASDGVGRNGLLSKVDLRADQYLSDLECSYRILEGRRGWLEVRGGVRYTNLFDRVILHPDEGAIEAASVRFVDERSKEIARELRRLIRGEESNLPIPPLTDEVREKVLRLILAAKQDPALAAAIKSHVLARIAEAKAREANRIAGILKRRLNQTLSVSNDWFDPYVGFAARYNLTHVFYVTAKADAGGFGVGSKFSAQVYGGLGCQITRTIFSEAGYRYLHVDYHQNGFLYQVAQDGAQITIGVNF